MVPPPVPRAPQVDPSRNFTFVATTQITATAGSDKIAYLELKPSIFTRFLPQAAFWEAVKVTKLSWQFVPMSAFHHGGRVGIRFDPDFHSAEPSTVATWLATYGSSIRGTSQLLALSSADLPPAVSPPLALTVKAQAPLRDDAGAPRQTFGQPATPLAIRWMTTGYEADDAEERVVGNLIVTLVVKFVTPKEIAPAEVASTVTSCCSRVVALPSMGDEQ